MRRGVAADQAGAGAARLIGLREVPTIVLDHLTEPERRAYVIADNRLAELAGWDREILAIELQALSELDLNFDLEITGFETAELDLLLDGADTPEALLRRLRERALAGERRALALHQKIVKLAGEVSPRKDPVPDLIAAKLRLAKMAGISLDDPDAAPGGKP